MSLIKTKQMNIYNNNNNNNDVLVCATNNHDLIYRKSQLKGMAHKKICCHCCAHFRIDWDYYWIWAMLEVRFYLDV